MGIRAVIDVVNQMQPDGVIDRYGIGGAVGATFFERILESKRALRSRLASLPVAEKLRLLDALRERQLTLRGRAVHTDSSAFPEPPAPDRAESK